MAACLVPLAIWILISGLDDLLLDAVFVWQWLRERREPPEELTAIPEKRLAVMVPSWKEHNVIVQMVEHNVRKIDYGNYELFLGGYPNDEPTLDAIRELEGRFEKVHVSVCPHDGPTSKADNLNWIYQRILRWEEEHATQFDAVITHDAEDVIHPEAFQWINHYLDRYDMVQIPVLGVDTKFLQWTRGIYCDEFAEYQTKDVPARPFTGAFLPSNGVGTGYSRQCLEKLAQACSNRVFEAECQTEDYENGIRLHELGCTQVFLPLRRRGESFLATGEKFPEKLRKAVRQRTRWLIGIALQSWERHGWRGNLVQRYWFWRDRKGLVGNLVTVVANVIFAYGFGTRLWAWWRAQPWGLDQVARDPAFWILLPATLSMQVIAITFRIFSVRRLYGWRFALGVPLRVPWANWINCAATVCAVYQYAKARLRGEPLVWLKTEHSYPSRAALLENNRRLGEVLVRSQYASAEEVSAALKSQPAGVRLGEYLVRLGKLSEAELYEALSLQHAVECASIDPRDIERRIARALPVHVVERWKVLPVKVAAGTLFLAGPEAPTDELEQELRKFTRLEVRFQLVTPSNFEELVRELL